MHQSSNVPPPSVTTPAPAPSERTRLRRRALRGSHELDQIRAILDAALICHVGFLREGAPSVIPCVFVRIDDAIYLHGSTANRAFRSIAAGDEVCIEVTHLDALVFARSAFHQSVDYRSVVVYGRGEVVKDDEAKLAALRATVEHVCPGRWEAVRPPSREEFLKTLVVRVPIVESSAKIRSSGVVDDESDLALDCWAGVIPVRLAADPPRPDASLRAGISLPEHIRTWTPPASRKTQVAS